MPAQELLSSPWNNAFKNFTSLSTTLPHHTANLLGLNLKYCLEKPRPYNQIGKGYNMFGIDFRNNSKFNFKDPPVNPTNRVSLKKKTKKNKVKFIIDQAALIWCDCKAVVYCSKGNTE